MDWILVAADRFLIVAVINVRFSSNGRDGNFVAAAQRSTFDAAMRGGIRVDDFTFRLQLVDKVLGVFQTSP